MRLVWAALNACLDSPFFASLSVHGLHFTVCAPSRRGVLHSGRAEGDGPKVTENAQNADFRRKPQIFADSPLLLEIPASGGRRKPQKTADFRRKPLIGLRHLRCVTFSSALFTSVRSEPIERGHVPAWGSGGRDPGSWCSELPCVVTLPA